MKQILRSLVRISVVTGALASAIAPAWAQAVIEYASPPIRARIVALESGRPLAHAHIVAFWEGSQAVPPLHPATRKLIETTSGADGTVGVPAWGPAPFPTPMKADSPGLLVYAPGYAPRWVSQGRAVQSDLLHEIQLLRAPGEPDARAKTLAELAWRLAYLVAPLRDQPPLQMLSAIEAEWQRFPEDARPVDAQGRRLTPIALFDRWVQELRARLAPQPLEQ